MRSFAITDSQPRTPEGVNGYAPGAALMTAAGRDSLRSELERLRERTRLEVAQRLREARSYGEGANNDEYHAVREEQMVLDARMASLEETIARATVVDSGDVEQGVAAIGSTVWVEGSRNRDDRPLPPDQRASADRTGRDLCCFPDRTGAHGSAPGNGATVELPNGRARSVRLVEVEVGTGGREQRQAAA